MQSCVSSFFFLSEQSGFLARSRLSLDGTLLPASRFFLLQPPANNTTGDFTTTTAIRWKTRKQHINEDTKLERENLPFSDERLRQLFSGEHVLFSSDSDIIRRNQEESRWDSDFAIDGKFHVAGLRGRIDRAGHLTPDGAFTWSKWIPNKVNCFVWRARIDRIPSASALMRRGVKIQGETCSVCISGSETADHMLVTCPFAIAIWNGIWNWCEIIPPQLSNVKEILNFVATCGKSQTKKRTINSIIFGTLWGMWKARNDRVFNSKFIPPELVFEGVRSMVYTWIKFRHGKGNFVWENWKNSPISSM
ncbi:unnamed protein product [Lactuca virosa]|uniref:Reverse transcriptase zinc-binding domain-containing protein n=1 Tax=Lactuca virosa TaxID=75947 RepID=A0AAU9MTR7_9ASTR|nr:unnamed protein product [Lactuca virosa]